VKDLIKLCARNRWRKSKCAIHFVYFSCSRDIELLSLSLKSLSRLKSNVLGKVFIVSDAKNEITRTQERELKKTISKLTILRLGQIDWASVETLKTELAAFGIAADEANQGDLIAKVDSDILFFDKSKLETIASASYDFIGDGHYSEYEYAQGGLYFLRTALAKRLSVQTTENTLHEAIETLGTVAEDRLISHLAKSCTKSIWLTRIMLFPREYERVSFTSKLLLRDFSTIHFVHQKNDMPIYAEKLRII
jgi:hypothetical protein